MEDIDARLSRIEQAIVYLSDLRDPANLSFPRVSNDARTRLQNQAERDFAKLANELRRELKQRGQGPNTGH